MQVFKSEFDGSYASGVAVIAANSQDEAIEMLKKRCEYFRVRGAIYTEDEKEWLSSNYTWSKPELIENLEYHHSEPNFLAYVRYME